METKHILITGINSYIGSAVKSYLLQSDDKYHVDSIDMIDQTWRDKSFDSYDIVFHVAGIAHQDTGKIDEERYKLYFSVNRDLTIEVAQKAKRENVEHFIHMSTMSVYGQSSIIGHTKEINSLTHPCPVNAYGESKLQADNEILSMQDSRFTVTVLRPPMVYGAGCKGNYLSLSKAAKKLPLFPYVQNERSMIYIGNLAAFIKNVIDKKIPGVLFPQNNEYVCTSDMVKEIAIVHGKRMLFTRLFNPLIRLLSGKMGVVDKVFGNLTYSREVSLSDNGRLPYSFRESIRLTEEIEGSNANQQP